MEDFPCDLKFAGDGYEHEIKNIVFRWSESASHWSNDEAIEIPAPSPPTDVEVVIIVDGQYVLTFKPDTREITGSTISFLPGKLTIEMSGRCPCCINQHNRVSEEEFERYRASIVMRSR